MTYCKICKKRIVGRSDKRFCTIQCKNYYHTQLRRVNKDATIEIDKILHRNRAILLECLGKRKTQIKLKRIILDKKKFNFTYHTHVYVNSKGKTFFWVYDLAWMTFSYDDVLIVRKR